MVLFGVSVNWLAVIVGTIASIIIGFIWYSKPLFGNVWMKSMEKGKKRAKDSMGPAMLGAIVAAFLSVFVLEVIIQAVPPISFARGIEIAGLVWLGFYVAMELVNLAFGRNSSKLFVINAVHHAIVLGIVASVLVFMG